MTCEVFMATEASQSNIAQGKLRNRLFTALTVWGLVFSLVFAFVLSPLITFANNDGTINYLPDILELAQWIFNLLTFFVCYALTVFAVYRFGASQYWVFILVFSLATVVKYLSNVVSAFFVFGVVPSGGELFEQTQIVVFNTSIELLQFAFIVISSVAIISRFKRLSEIAERGAKKIGIDYDSRSKVFPFKSLVSTKNPLQYSALIAALIVSAFMITNRLVYDFSMGLPVDLVDGLWMAAGYISDILFGVIGYLIMIVIFNRCDTLDIKYRVKFTQK